MAIIEKEIELVGSKGEREQIGLFGGSYPRWTDPQVPARP